MIDSEKALWTVGAHSYFFRDCRKAVLYSSKAVIARFAKPFILMSNTVRQHCSP